MTNRYILTYNQKVITAAMYSSRDVYERRYLIIRYTLHNFSTSNKTDFGSFSLRREKIDQLRFMKRITQL